MTGDSPAGASGMREHRRIVDLLPTVIRGVSRGAEFTQRADHDECTNRLGAQAHQRRTFAKRRASQ